MTSQNAPESADPLNGADTQSWKFTEIIRDEKLFQKWPVLFLNHWEVAEIKACWLVAKK